MSSKTETTMAIIGGILAAVIAASTSTWALSNSARVRDMKEFVREYHYQMDTNTTRINSHEDHIMAALDDRNDIKVALVGSDTVLAGIAEDIKEIKADLKTLQQDR